MFSASVHVRQSAIFRCIVHEWLHPNTLVIFGATETTHTHTRYQNAREGERNDEHKTGKWNDLSQCWIHWKKSVFLFHFHKYQRRRRQQKPTRQENGSTAILNSSDKSNSQQISYNVGSCTRTSLVLYVALLEFFLIFIHLFWIHIRDVFFFFFDFLLKSFALLRARAVSTELNGILNKKYFSNTWIVTNSEQ